MIHTPISIVSHLWNPKCTWCYGVFCTYTMDVWYYRIIVACDTMEFEFILLSPLLAWSSPLGLPKRRGICMHQHSTSDMRERRRRRRRWHSTYWYMAQLTSLVICIDDRIYDIRERNVTIRSEIWTTNILHCLGFGASKEWVILWGFDITEFRVYLTYHLS